MEQFEEKLCNAVNEDRLAKVSFKEQRYTSLEMLVHLDSDLYSRSLK